MRTATTPRLVESRSRGLSSIDEVEWVVTEEDGRFVAAFALELDARLFVRTMQAVYDVSLRVQDVAR